MMKSSFVSQLALLLLSLSSLVIVNVVTGFSTGAGQCVEGGPSVSGSHLNNPTTGTLEDGGITVHINEDYQLSTSKVANILLNDEHELFISTSNGTTYRGILIRLHAADGAEAEGALIPVDDNLHMTADICDTNDGTTSGVTHENNNERTSTEALLNMEEDSDGLLLDITVVVINSGGQSEYYYSQYVLNSVTADQITSTLGVEDAISNTTTPTTGDTGDETVTNTTDTPTTTDGGTTNTGGDTATADTPTNNTTVGDTTTSTGETTTVETATGDEDDGGGTTDEDNGGEEKEEQPDSSPDVTSDKQQDDEKQQEDDVDDKTNIPDEGTKDMGSDESGAVGDDYYANKQTLLLHQSFMLAVGIIFAIE